ncbi:hypothetical protein Belba_2511 [Belliella baltica DSM 15883]|uniref:Methyltransferase FkbM domain-containing protein n=1 Tax=Belliella baltica (strain DSM 15883 / CIP 108006 / LMG 21964 / BA134) TaxID=866536 RepID=I3Z747_BELBD|nr:hypothetical protein [Belliella baltica]AFL85065.1 hypothetical protein Belba_2511 [Belliella baltica DSM 15883]
MNLLKKIRVKLYYLRLDLFRKNLLKKLINYSSTSLGSKYKSEINFLKEHGLTVFPYSFIKNYSKSEIKINKIDNLMCVEYFGKNLFFPKNFSHNQIIDYAYGLFLEQDELSPHSYNSPIFRIDNDDILLDIGCAEANYSLSMIEQVKKVYLFEPNEIWIQPLQHTFSNWKNKVEIFNQRYGDRNELNHPDLSREFLNQNILIKIDVDGNEREVLELIEPLFSIAKSVKIAICTYHQNNDADDFDNFFKTNGFQTRFGRGYMLFYYDRQIQKPYLRPGVLFAYRNMNV